LAACFRSPAPEKRRKAAPLLKFIAVDCEFIDFCLSDKYRTGRRLTLYQASALGKCWFPPIRDEARGPGRRHVYNQNDFVH
jgi:hypothetical protein